VRFLHDVRRDDPRARFERELAARRAEERADFAEAEAELAERYALSEQASYGFHLIRLVVEGYRVSGPGTKSAQRVAREELAGASE
jgi:hypothetical protein